MYDADDFSLFADKETQVVKLTMKQDVHETARIEEIARVLKLYLAKVSKRRAGAPVSLLIDLRRCHDFTPQHVLGTVTILMGEKKAVLEYLVASAVLFEVNELVERLAQGFHAMYKPSRPFGIFAREHEATDFLLEHGPRQSTSQP